MFTQVETAVQFRLDAEQAAEREAARAAAATDQARALEERVRSLEATQAESMRSVDAAQELRDQLDHVQGTADLLRESEKRLREECDRLAVERDAARDRLAVAEEECARLQAECSDLVQENKRLVAERGGPEQSAVHGGCRHCGELEDEVAALKQTYSLACDEFDQHLRHKAASHQSAIDVLNARIADLELAVCCLM
jgi:chromosome segregation ATPase